MPTAFPSNDSVTRPPPSLLTGSPGFGYPAFHRYYEAAKTSRSSSRKLAFPRLTVPSLLPLVLRVLPPMGARGPRPWAWGLVSRVCPFRLFWDGNYGISRVPRQPQCAFAPLLDPGRAVITKPLRCHGVAPASLTTKAPATTWFRSSITRLLHLLSTLRAAIADDYARLASGRWLTVTGWAYLPPGCDEGFQTCAIPPSWASRRDNDSGFAGRDHAVVQIFNGESFSVIAINSQEIS